MAGTRRIVVWLVLTVAVVTPIAFATVSPLLEWRDPVYITAGLAGVVALALLLFQPLLAVGWVPGVSSQRGRLAHRWLGGALVLTVVIHVGALWVTSPPDVIDALLFASPTPFSVWGVIAMWAVFASALMAGLRWQLRLRPRSWRLAHTALATVIVVGSIVHAMLIEGTMELVSKTALCALVIAATAMAIANLRVWAKRAR